MASSSVEDSEFSNSKFKSLDDSSSQEASHHINGSTSSRRRGVSVNSFKPSTHNTDNSDKNLDNNPLIKAMGLLRKKSVLGMNTKVVVTKTDDSFEIDDPTGLNDEQKEILSTTRFLFRYNDGWRTYWDLFVMFLAIWN